MDTSTFNIIQFIRPHLQQLKPYSTARDDFQGMAEVFLDANENPYPSAFNRYPDPHQLRLKEKIGLLKKVKTENIFIGNGSDEVIDLLIRLCCEPRKDTILTIDPTYGMYEVSAQINGVSTIKFPLTESFELVAEKLISTLDNTVKIIFLCTPNNPSGNLLNKEEIRKIIRAFKGLIVIDEAYIDFADDEGFLPELGKWPNLVVMQTLSKAYGLAGLRLGVAFADSAIIGWLNKIKPPYNISQAAQQHALQHLKNAEIIQNQINEIKAEREKLFARLRMLKIVEKVFPSDANFLLVRFVHSRPVYDYLLQKGIIVRDRSSVRHGNNCLRITIGTPEENKRLIDALQKFNYT